MIRKIHQIWYQGQENIPDTFRQYSSRWKKINPGFEHTLWDSNSIDMFMKKHYPSVYKNFLSLPYMIQKIDVFKYAVLNKQGGFYIDMDVDCLRPLTTLPSKYHDSDFIASRAPSFFYENLIISGELYLYNNAVLYSRPNNTILDKMIQNSFNYDCKNINKTKCVFMTTGPVIYSKIINIYKNRMNKMSSLPSFYFEPVWMPRNNKIDTFINRLNKKQIGEHKFTSTWIDVGNLEHFLIVFNKLYIWVRYILPMGLLYITIFKPKKSIIVLLLYVLTFFLVNIYFSLIINIK